MDPKGCSISGGVIKIKRKSGYGDAKNEGSSKRPKVGKKDAPAADDAEAGTQ